MLLIKKLTLKATIYPEIELEISAGSLGSAYGKNLKLM
jgi:hypothetical protein